MQYNAFGDVSTESISISQSLWVELLKHKYIWNEDKLQYFECINGIVEKEKIDSTRIHLEMNEYSYSSIYSFLPSYMKTFIITHTHKVDIYVYIYTFHASRN